MLLSQICSVLLKGAVILRSLIKSRFKKVSTGKPIGVYNSLLLDDSKMFSNISRYLSLPLIISGKTSSNLSQAVLDITNLLGNYNYFYNPYYILYPISYILIIQYKDYLFIVLYVIYMNVCRGAQFEY